jgi:aspartate/methionine/tyrosine aminotransferase
MDTSLAWLYELEARYAEETGKTPWSLSDWHNDPGDVILPLGLLSSLTIEPEAATRYMFLDTSERLKKLISNFYFNSFDFCLPYKRMAFCHNGTSSVHLIIQVLAQKGMKRALVVTPAYFSLLSTLERCDVATIYYHLDLLSGLELDAESIIEVAKAQMIQAIFITSPIFSAGRKISVDALSQISNFTEKEGIHLIIDETLAGLPWIQLDKEPYLSQVMRMAVHSRRCVYTFSVTKSLFINGIKHSIIFGCRDFISSVERLADHIMGGLTISQVDLAAHIYSEEYFQDICKATRTNVNRFRENYDLCKSTLMETPLRVMHAESGLHCIVYVPTKCQNPKRQARKIVELMMFTHGYSAIPLAHFGFPPFSPLGFRINLSKEPGKLHSALGSLAKIIHENSDFLNQ